MFDSAACDRELSKVPLYFSFGKYPWLKPALIAAILLLLLFGLRWVIQNKRLRRWFSRPRTLVFLFCFTAALPFLLVLADKVVLAALPPDPGTKADAIVVLGRGWQFFHRYDLAAELWKAKRAPLIFTSGVNDAKVSSYLFRQRNVPRQVQDSENCSLTTEENALFTAAILKPQGIRRIILITDPPHMWRSLLVFRAQGFEVIPKPSPLPSYMGFKAKTFITFREYMGLISYGLRGLFFAQRSPEADNPELANLIEEAKQYGQQQNR